MLIAVAVGDETRFRSIWEWTKTHLRGADGLLAWRWAENKVTDVNSASLQYRQTFGVTVMRGDRRAGRATSATNASGGTSFDKPVDNIGVKTIPDYAGYAAKHVQAINIPGCSQPGRVFVGQRHEQCLYVLGQHVAAPQQQGMRAGRAQQRQAGAWGQADAHARMLPAAGEQGLHVADQGVAGMHGADRALQFEDFGLAQHRAGLRDQPAAVLADQQHAFGLGRGIAHRQAQQEAVELRVRQRIGTGQVHRVLRGDDEERRRQRPGDAVDGDLLLGHRLQQRALGAGRRAVDLVGQQDVAEDRPRMELETALAGVVNRYAHHVRGQQVGGELHALEAEAQRRRQRMRQRGLAKTRQVLDQHMAAGQQGDERQAHLLRLAQH